MAPSGKSVTPERAGDKDKALEAALLQIERQFGKGSVMRLGEESRVPVEVIPSGSIALDVALGIGGYPRGRIVEVYGPESSGKTPSTRSTRSTRRSSAWTPRRCWSLSRTPASRPWRSWTC
jgi:hypothetical protein